MKIKEKYLKILKSNQIKANNHYYTLPSSSYYPHQWFWDSCFHAIIYLRFGLVKEAKNEINSLLSRQWENGMIPHMIYWTLSDEFLEEWGTDKQTSSITQPPMIAYAVERIFNQTDMEFVKKVFDNLDRYYKWLIDERSDDYLVSIIHPWESGLDDFVSWDSVYGILKPSKAFLKIEKRKILSEYVKTGLDSRRFMKKNIFNVKCLVFNSIYLRNLKSMLKLAKVIGSKEVGFYEDLIKKTESSFKKKFLNRKTGLLTTFFNKGFVKNDMNFSIFMPMFASVLSKTEAKKLVDKFLLDDDLFWTKYPVPTVAKNNPDFEGDRYWRGSIWINVNWFIVRGLRDYGFEDVADEIKEKNLKLVEKTGFFEYFNPLNGKGLGPSDFSWSGLVFDMD